MTSDATVAQAERDRDIICSACGGRKPYRWDLGARVCTPCFVAAIVCFERIWELGLVGGLGKFMTHQVGYQLRHDAGCWNRVRLS